MLSILDGLIPVSNLLYAHAVAFQGPGVSSGWLVNMHERYVALGGCRPPFAVQTS